MKVAEIIQQSLMVCEVCSLTWVGALQNLEQDHQGKDDESENVRAVDADNMDEESLQEAVGLLSQLEASCRWHLALMPVFHADQSSLQIQAAGPWPDVLWHTKAVCLKAPCLCRPTRRRLWARRHC